MSLIDSNNLAVSPNADWSFTQPIIDNKINCKYFQMVSFVLSLISQFHKYLKLTPGKNSVFITESSLKISTFWYRISKKRSGHT